MNAISSPDILIVDDHPLFREALETAIARATNDRATIRHCGRLDDAVTAVKSHRPDLLLLDLNLGDCSGFDGIVRLKSVAPGLPVAIVSASEGAQVYCRARTLGAFAYLPKSLTIETLSGALRDVLDGESWFPADTQACEAGETEAASRVATLTRAQRRVLDGLSGGLLNKQIAHEMGISEATVKAHMTAIFRKLGVNNRTQALLMLKDATALGDYSAA